MNTEFVVAWEDVVEGDKYSGTLLNSAFCPVNGCWHLLIACSDGTLKHLRSDALGVEIFGVANEEEEESDSD